MQFDSSYSCFECQLRFSVKSRRKKNNSKLVWLEIFTRGKLVSNSFISSTFVYLPPWAPLKSSELFSGIVLTLAANASCTVLAVYIYLSIFTFTISSLPTVQYSQYISIYLYLVFTFTISRLPTVQARWRAYMCNIYLSIYIYLYNI